MEANVSSAVRAATCCWLISARAMFVARYSAARPAAPTTNRCRWSSDGLPTNSPVPVTAGLPPFYGGLPRLGRRHRSRTRPHRATTPAPRSEPRIDRCTDLLLGGAGICCAVWGSNGMATNSPEPVTAGQPPFYGGIRRTGRRTRWRPRRHRENTPPPRAEQRVDRCLEVLVGGAGVWWAVLGSNQRHPACKAGALPLS